VRASKFWGTPSLKQLGDLQRKMTGKRAALGDAETFEMLTERWRERALAFDPRLVGEWSLEIPVPGEPRLSCEMRLPDGVEAEILPPIEKRVAIGGKFLDEVRIVLDRKAGVIALLSYPLPHHWGVVGDDGSVMVHAKMPTAVSLLAEGVLPPRGGAAVELMSERRTRGGRGGRTERRDAVLPLQSGRPPGDGGEPPSYSAAG